MGNSLSWGHLSSLLAIRSYAAAEGRASESLSKDTPVCVCMCVRMCMCARLLHDIGPQAPDSRSWTHNAQRTTLDAQRTTHNVGRTTHNVQGMKLSVQESMKLSMKLSVHQARNEALGVAPNTCSISRYWLTNTRSSVQCEDMGWLCGLAQWGGSG